MGAEALRDDTEAPAPALPESGGSAEPMVFDVSEAVHLPPPNHPLRQLHDQALRDRLSPLDGVVHDHGSCGDWPLPSRSYWQAMERAGCEWPRGDHEAQAVQTARKEYKWRGEAVMLNRSARSLWLQKMDGKSGRTTMLWKCCARKGQRTCEKGER